MIVEIDVRQELMKTRRDWEELALRTQDGGLTTQHDMAKRHKSFLIWAIFDRNWTFKWLKVSISFNFIIFSWSKKIRVDGSWSNPDRQSKLILSDFCTCLLPSSKWTALVAMQANIMTWTSFRVFWLSLICMGPNMSMHGSVGKGRRNCCHL